MSTPLPRPTAIIDFADSLTDPPVRRRFAHPTREIRATSIARVVAAIDEAEQLARAGHWVVGFVAYEAAPAFDSALSTHDAGLLPLAWFAAFDRPENEESPPTVADGSSSPCEPVDAASPESRCGSAPGSAATEAREDLSAPGALLSDDEYATRLSRIHGYISAGDVYQVNLTVPFTSSSVLDPLALYERMRLAQGGHYSAYLDIGEARIMSASPELFLARSGTTVQSRPMKGTSPRGPSAASDRVARDELLRSEKDCAENVMIVDVVRNDLGRVASVGSVRVPGLCVAERYPSVWQLTSTVAAEVSDDIRLSALFSALFPAASITGAPKIRATEIIRELESLPRGVYCGAIGFIRPGGDACFNVAIRTAWTDDGARSVHLNAGGGVTIDSTPDGELAEVRAKIAAFTTARARPTLLETIRVERGAPVRLSRHLARMAESADYFGQPFDATFAEELLRGESRKHQTLELARARLVLAPDGALRATIESFADEAPADVPRPVSIALRAVDRGDVMLYHKTTSRGVYDAALADAPDSFDVVLWNAEGEVTELTRGNLVVELDGAQWTPPQECGLLAGTLRAELLENGTLRERILTLEDVARASRLWFINSLRGRISVMLETDASR